MQINAREKRSLGAFLKARTDFIKGPLKQGSLQFRRVYQRNESFLEQKQLVYILKI